jgi:hypothetical protein
MSDFNDAMNLPMYADARIEEMQIRTAIHETTQVQVRIINEQMQLEHERFADGFGPGKDQNVIGVGLARYIQTK